MGRTKKADNTRLIVHVVSHTHWDREWYHTAAVFRQRLVALIDDLLEAVRADAKLKFLLDGQAVAVEDYLNVRPERRQEIAKLLRSGVFEAGPWYVLADELIPTGEALVRNLLAGRRALSSLGAPASKVLYCPDSFGHPATLPAIARGFGCELIVLWRGFGGSSHPASNVVEWSAPDGSNAPVYHLPRSGYELGSALPDGATEASSRWRELRPALTERDEHGLVMLTNGADHHFLQRSLRESIAVLAKVAAPDNIVRSSLSLFAKALTEKIRRGSLPAVRGELRDSYGYTWTLQGTFASRIGLKRSLSLATRTLSREAEPWSALASARYGVGRKHHVEAAWRPLLLSMPHDTICGCSTDEVAADASLRLRDSIDQGRAIARDAIEEHAGYDRVSVRDARDQSRKDIVVVTNSAARPRGGVATIWFTQKLRDIKVGPGSAIQPEGKLKALIPRSFVSAGNKDSRPLVAQLLETRSHYDLIESPQHYPDADIVMERHMLVWCPTVSGYGILPLQPKGGVEPQSMVRPKHLAEIAERSIGNGLVSAGVTADNRIWLAHPVSQSVVSKVARATGVSASKGDGEGQRAMLSVEDCYDAGDLYTPSIRHAPTITERVRTWKFVDRGPLRCSMVVRYEWSSSVEKKTEGGFVIKGSRTSKRDRSVPRISQLRGWLEVTLSVDADSSFVRLSLRGDNRSKHHRLRLVISSDMKAVETVADAAFAAVRREAVKVREEDLAMEIPPATAPLHRFVTVLNKTSGMTIASDGSGEYESSEDGRIAVTILRAVGELSRHDLAERPGHAGWPANTPAAQEQGPFKCAFAWIPHSGGSWDRVAAGVDHTVEDFLHPLSGITLRYAEEITDPGVGVELSGAGLSLSAIKESEDGKHLVLRCVNLTSRPVSGSWHLGHKIRAAVLARLDETPIRKLSVKRGRAVGFIAPSNGIVTILVR